MDEVVLLQVATAESDVPGHLQQLPHWQRRGLILEIGQCQWDTRRLWHKHTRVLQTHTARGLFCLRKLFMSPPVMSSSRMKRGRMFRLTPIQRTMFSWPNLLRRQNNAKQWRIEEKLCGRWKVLCASEEIFDMTRLRRFQCNEWSKTSFFSSSGLNTYSSLLALVKLTLDNIYGPN